MTPHRIVRRIAPVALALAAGTSVLLAASPTFRADGVDKANLRSDLLPMPNVVMPGLALVKVAGGSDALENPSGVITKFGYLDDFPPQTIEASKTEPDENLYLVLASNPGGPTAGYNYGHRFLFQGHENGGDLAYVTRVNLDVKDAAHRITLLTPVGADGKTHLNRIDGSTWNPFTNTMLFTQENGNVGGVIEIGATWGATAHTLYGILGQGGYEGIHPDDQGNLLIVEDVGGTSVLSNPLDAASPKSTRVPNSYVYRFVPNDVHNLSAGGKLQALQVTIDGHAVSYVPVDATHPTGDAFSDAQLKLHTPGSSWPVGWVTIHDTTVDGTAAFDANALARTKGATPFKRPENMAFLPGSGFRTFFFAATGDTSITSGGSGEAARRGAWGSLLRVDLDSSRSSGTISLFFLGDAEHSSFDNLAFADDRLLIVGEDRGDPLHKQLSKLDSIWVFDVRSPAKASGPSAPMRLLALGRDTESTVDSHLLEAATAGFQNDGDNEATGVFVSNGDPTAKGILGRFVPGNGARWFFTQQHGLNTVYEIKAAPKH